jgi:hypothetical protein
MQKTCAVVGPVTGLTMTRGYSVMFAKGIYIYTYVYSENKTARDDVLEFSDSVCSKFKTFCDFADVLTLTSEL